MSSRILVIAGLVISAGCQSQFADGYYLDTDLVADTGMTKDEPSDTSPETETASDSQTDTFPDHDSDSQTASEVTTDSASENDTAPGTECDFDLELCHTKSDPDFSYDVCMKGWCVSPGTCGDSVSCNAAGVYYRIPPADVDTTDYMRTLGVEPIVVDNATELIWQGCPAGQREKYCGVKEDDVPEPLPAKKFTWEKALQYCDNLVWNGLDGWHLPSEYELLTIVDFGTYNPAIDLMAFPGDMLPLWTSSVVAGKTDTRWMLDFAYGDLVNVLSNVSAYVRCVFRGPASSPDSDRFKRTTSTAEHPVVEDAETGLAWQGCPAGSSGTDCSTGSPKNYRWQEAVDYCKTLVWGGHEDWYLPDIKVLQSIVDNRSSSFAMNRTFFPQAGEEGEYWSSTGEAKNEDAAWFVNFHEYSVARSAKTYAFRVRCARFHF